MSERRIPENFGSKLLQQDESLHSKRYQEHRMQLEHQLARAESRERLTKRVVVGALLVATALFPVAASGVFGSADPFDKDATALSIAAGALHVVAWAVFFVGAASYYSRYSPRVRRGRDELLREAIRELRHDVADLRRLVEGMSKTRQAEQRGPE